MHRTQVTAGPLRAGPLPAGPLPAVATPAADAERAGHQWPVVVLTYAYSGAARIQHLLAASPALACTSGTGLLLACAQAAAAWHNVDNRDGPLSSLAVSSIRALAGGMISVILADAGRSRWCEISSSPPAAGEAFLRLYPGTKFLCQHRSCPDVVRACVSANRWGLAGSGLVQFAAAYPGSSAAAVAAYWAERTESLLRFADAHPAACRQVRYEDLAGPQGPEAREIFAFLGLDEPVTALPGGQAAPPEETGAALADDPVPSSHLPPPLAERVNGLQARLGYPPIT